MMSDKDIKEYHDLDKLKSGLKKVINTTIYVVNSSRILEQGPGFMT